ncbi:PilZ domain-containing protein [Massilia sp. DWR3-1-1]|uniref:PilZ domain-containing protein n=1 Tax=Massilia sp. DWR3-1-1 TaxID=2804559 RepID=UPI003CF8F173
MDTSPSANGPAAGPASGAEQRNTQRKLLKARAVLTVKGAPPLAVRTIDISVQGASLSFLQPLPVGLAGTLSIDLMIDGKLNTVSMLARATYCIYSGGQYKVGFQFTGIDLPTVTLLAKFVR